MASLIQLGTLGWGGGGPYTQAAPRAWARCPTLGPRGGVGSSRPDLCKGLGGPRGGRQDFPLGSTPWWGGKGDQLGGWWGVRGDRWGAVPGVADAVVRRQPGPRGLALCQPTAHGGCLNLLQSKARSGLGSLDPSPGGPSGPGLYFQLNVLAGKTQAPSESWVRGRRGNPVRRLAVGRLGRRGSRDKLGPSLHRGPGPFPALGDRLPLGSPVGRYPARQSGASAGFRFPLAPWRG